MPLPAEDVLNDFETMKSAAGFADSIRSQEHGRFLLDWPQIADLALGTLDKPEIGGTAVIIAWTGKH